MIAVLFEVEPATGRREAYLEQAAKLLPRLRAIDGFVSIERFASLSDPGKILSLSFFRDEAAVAAWRNDEQHRLSQALGRAGLFSAYRLRVAEVRRDYGQAERAEIPADSAAVHSPGNRAPTS
jgi:heme-degrading monooxygenase HmoA